MKCRNGKDQSAYNPNVGMTLAQAVQSGLRPVQIGQTKTKEGRAFIKLSKIATNVLLLKLAGFTYKQIQGYYPFSTRTLKRYISEAKDIYPQVIPFL
jgi:hypothetical protein